MEKKKSLTLEETLKILGAEKVEYKDLSPRMKMFYNFGKGIGIIKEEKKEKE